MLSSAAFNALLKTLEEPPAHVVFILATTEPQKIPATILSRVQRFDFGRIPAPLIIARMEEALAGMSASAEPEALQMLARGKTVIDHQNAQSFDFFDLELGRWIEIIDCGIEGARQIIGRKWLAHDQTRPDWRTPSSRCGRVSLEMRMNGSAAWRACV